MARARLLDVARAHEAHALRAGWHGALDLQRVADDGLAVRRRARHDREARRRARERRAARQPLDAAHVAAR